MEEEQDEEEEEDRAELVVLRALLGRWSAIVLFVSSQSSFWRAISSPCTRSLHDPPPRLVLQRHTMEPGQFSNMCSLSAVLVDQAPPSCWLNDLAPRTVAEVEWGREGEGDTKRAQHEGRLGSTTYTCSACPRPARRPTATRRR